MSPESLHSIEPNTSAPQQQRQPGIGDGSGDQEMVGGPRAGSGAPTVGALRGREAARAGASGTRSATKGKLWPNPVAAPCLAQPLRQQTQWCAAWWSEGS